MELIMEKKYELVKEDSIEVEGRTLYRIRALREFGDLENGVYYVDQGDLGGYIQKKRIFLMKDIAGCLTTLKYSTMQ